METNAYRLLRNKIALPSNGTIPPAESVAKEEQKALRSRLQGLRRAIHVVSVSQRQMLAPSVPTAAETYCAWDRWLLSHHYFIVLLAMAGHSLSCAAGEMREGRREPAGKWVRLASRMRRGCAACFLYSVDFEPCSTIYCREIRTRMPAAFSGYEIRERQHGFLPGVGAFEEAFPRASPDRFIAEMRSLWAAAEKEYHELHVRCMVLAVPVTGNQKIPESLRAAYGRQHGSAPAVGEAEYREYDRWFGIERRNDLTRLDFVFQVSGTIERLLADLLVGGHRQDAAVIGELLDSMKAAIIVFESWLKPADRLSFGSSHLREE